MDPDQEIGFCKYMDRKGSAAMLTTMGSMVALWSWVRAPNLHQYLPTHLQYVDQKGSAAMLTSIQSAGVTLGMNLRNLLCAGEEARKRGNPPWL